MSQAKASYYYENQFIESVAPNENGIVTDFHALHARERGYAMTADENLLRRATEKEAGINWEYVKVNGWSSITDAQAEEAEALYLSARYGEAQLKCDEILERRRADNARYY